MSASNIKFTTSGHAAGVTHETAIMHEYEPNSMREISRDKLLLIILYMDTIVEVMAWIS